MLFFRMMSKIFCAQLNEQRAYVWLSMPTRNKQLLLVLSSEIQAPPPPDGFRDAFNCPLLCIPLPDICLYFHQFLVI